MEDAVDFKKIGENIRIQRTSKGMNQQELGDVLGISNSGICSYEKGKSEIPLKYFFQLCDFFKKTPDELAGRKRKRNIFE
jgi:transcriptional regulator with XRE-family HTH domain